MASCEAGCGYYKRRDGTMDDKQRWGHTLLPKYRKFGQLAWVLSVGESGDSGFVFGFVGCKYPDQTSVS